MSSHRGVDLSLYDEIIDVIKFHTSIQKTDLSVTKLYHRKDLTATLSSLYQLNELKPLMQQIAISDGSIVTVPIFDVKAVILSILHDPQKMQFENFAPDYDIFCGRSTKPVTHYHKINTGDQWGSSSILLWT